MEIVNYLRPTGRGLKLHLGCGDYWYDGYINIDHVILGGTDMLWDLREKLPFQDKTVEIIESYDFVEHFTKVEINKMLDDWYRVLIDGGKVIALVPDMEELLKMGDLQQIYGIEQDHKWGYTVNSLTELFHKFKVESCIKVEVKRRPGEPKLEIICQK
jgi:predicted SAM-dependent methyltransferase